MSIQRPLLILQNLLISDMNSHYSLTSCCSLLVLTNALRHPDATFNHSKSVSQLLNHHGPRFTFRLRFLSFFTAALLLTFNKMVDREHLIMGVPQLEDIFSIVRTNLRTWFNVLSLRADEADAERR
jgi:hypothetical protein